jgi:hypothetical protein
MIAVLVRLAMLGALAACDAPPPGRAPVPPAQPPSQAAPAQSREQLRALGERCGGKAREQFRRDWKDGGARFDSHYNAKLNTCFYLLTVGHPANGGTVRITLFDIDGGEQYGEYSGAAAAESPAACRVEAMYCASGREWEVLLRPYMED